MNILERIAADKRKEVEQNKVSTPFRALERMSAFKRTGYSLQEVLRGNERDIITEFKRRSPSNPDIHPQAEIRQVVPGYEKAGAAGLSVLTDAPYFGGSNKDLMQARELVEIPILRKDFIIDEYQIVEAKAIGADVILLIASLLSKQQIKAFSKTALNLGLEILLEVHDERELQASLVPEVQLIGVNNRNLKTFEVDLNTSKKLSELIPPEFVKISESGISQSESVKELRTYGFQGFLMGENFMKTDNPSESAEGFIQSL